ncbi:MAG TPA: outer membrane beta-barrel protein [Bacteroidales bacterium]|nr:outer membrane beta-barrel protein [Bacteroidales bacterium]
MKLLKTLFLLLLPCLAVQAQQFNAGIRGGLSATQISGDQLSGFNRAGPVAGPFVNLYLWPRACVQMEMVYIQKGSRKNPDPDKNDFNEYRLRLDYIEVPVVYRLDYNERFSLEAGLALAALLNTREIGYPPLAPTPAFNKQDLSVLGGGYFRFGERLYVNLRYQSSILPVRDHLSGATFRLNKGQYNSVLVFALHYQISRLR